MTADQATEEIIELVYHSAVVSDDPWVQEVHTSTAVRDILEELLNSKTGNEEDLEYEIQSAEREIEDLKNIVGGLEVDNEVLRSRLRAAEELRELSTP